MAKFPKPILNLPVVVVLATGFVGFWMRKKVAYTVPFTVQTPDPKKNQIDMGGLQGKPMVTVLGQVEKRSNMGFGHDACMVRVWRNGLHNKYGRCSRHYWL